MSVKVDSVLISMTTVGCAPQQAHMLRAARTHTRTRDRAITDKKKEPRSASRRRRELWSCVPVGFGGVNENLISSSKPLHCRRSGGGEGVLDLINLSPYWIGRLPGADQLCPIMRLNDKRSSRVSCEKNLNSFCPAELSESFGFFFFSPAAFLRATPLRGCKLYGEKS